jgi:DNA transformation protein and related proteins
MAVTKEFSAYVHEQLHLLPAVTSRRMFGGIGLYSDGLFFALLADDTLYCKVDDGNRADYLERGMRAFTPFPDKPGLNYYAVPAEVLEDAEELARWARKSVAAALVAATRKVKVPGLVARKSKVRRPAAKRKGTNSKIR